MLTSNNNNNSSGTSIPLTSSSSYIPAVRLAGGIIHGTIYRTAASQPPPPPQQQQTSPPPPPPPPPPQNYDPLPQQQQQHPRNSVSCFAVFTGTNLNCYESFEKYQRGDFPLQSYHIVGASSAMSLEQHHRQTTNAWCCFRCMTNRGTQIDCWVATESCRFIWLNGLQAGLELSLIIPGVMPRSSSTWNCNASTTTITTSSTTGNFFTTRSAAIRKKWCVSCGATMDHPETSAAAIRNNYKYVQKSIAPIPQSGYESRQDLCIECTIAQGVCDHLYFMEMCYVSDVMERETIAQARIRIYDQFMMGTDTTTTTTTDGADTDPPAPEADVIEYLQTLEFRAFLRKSPKLERIANQFLSGKMVWMEFIEQLDAIAGSSSPEESPELLAVSLKKQAFRMAGDMGTAMKLLMEQTIQQQQQQQQAISNLQHNTEVLQCVLEFFLDLCQEGGSHSVAFFWPQLCHIHLRMLPPTNSVELARVELMEDFLITVATKYSIHLALQLVWSHTADLEESLQIPLCNASPHTETIGNTSSLTGSTTETAVAHACRRRRFATLRFLCELESILFAFEGGWGGGSISLGKFLQPTPQQVELMKASFMHIQNLRVETNQTCTQSVRSRLSRSARYDLIMAKERNKNLSPEIQAEEKLRVARNADYFTCHLNFTKRLSDITERLRFMDVNERAEFLEEELNLLNASGTMGGDPLNRVQDSLIRVVRVPSTESHVFRSKERTPVLLLVEVVDELAESEVFPEEESIVVGKEGSEKSHHAIDRLDSTALDQSKRQSENYIPPAKEENCQSITRSSTESGSELAGSYDGFKVTHSPKALKRFDNDGDEIDPIQNPRTPKRDVAELVNHAAQEQLKELALPDMDNLTPTKEDNVIQGINEKNSLVGSSFSPQKDLSTRKVDVERSHQNAEEIAEGRKEIEKNLGMKEKGRKKRTEKTSKKKSTLGSLSSLTKDVGESTNTLAPTGDVRRSVLTTIMMRGIQGNTIAAGAADSVTRSLQELERKRATELLLSDDGDQNSNDCSSERDDKIESARQKLVSLGLTIDLDEAELATRPSEEDEVMESIRLLLIQNRVNQGHLSQDDAAKVLQHTSLSNVNAAAKKTEREQVGKFDIHDYPTIDAGDVDSRLVGCGPLPPAVMQALTLWKGGMVTNAELLELVKKDIEFVKHSVLFDAQSYAQENSAFWGRFSYGERWAEKKARIASSSPHGAVPGWDLLGVIVKSNDDLRQEAFIMQLIELCQEAFELSVLELWINPYRILATGRTTGVIECVRNAMSFDALKKRPGYGKGGLREHLLRMTEFTADPGDAFKNAQRNFVRSLAAYSLMSYFFLFKDRHNGNLLLDTAGHVIHIDFGFVFGVAPGGSFSLEMSTPFKLTDEMLDVMGGLRSPLFSEFVILFCCGFLALQSHCDTFLTLVEITCEGSTFKCFEGQTTEEIVAKLKERFSPHLSKEETVSLALDLIKQATTSYGTRQYDLFQYLSQGIVA